MPAALTRPILNNTSGMLTFSPAAFVGYSVRETAGARAVLRFRDGNQTDDPRNILLTISLAAGESARDWFQPNGIAYQYGLYVEIVSGTIEGSVQVTAGGEQ